ncbi:collagen-like protein [Geitlerinema sp. PCC 7407]|uniref:collagen-like triple helix repeat-containing protein n=1 Tax=Geitlerinema sp. PCC 7407 TaxID=1173025 RepID=UPI00029FAE66|nr:collagen-like protein [Geitlerinema sp. PCC 7407]AFY64678.1 Collagen triple helix repeat-containing protein [Geitlerinema sp. PCC 7407]
MSDECCKRLEKELREIRRLVEAIDTDKFVLKEQFGQFMKDNYDKIGLLVLGSFSVGAAALTLEDLPKVKTHLEKNYALTMNVNKVDQELVDENRRLKRYAQEELNAVKDKLNGVFYRTEVPGLETRLNTKAGEIAEAKVGPLRGAINVLENNVGGLKAGLQALFKNFGDLLVRLGPLFDVLGLIANLADTIAILHILGGRIDAVERVADAARADASYAITLATGALNGIKRLQGLIDGLSSQLKVMGGRIDAAALEAANALRKSFEALGQSGKAIADALKAQQAAELAAIKAVNAERTSLQAQVAAIAAGLVANRALGSALDAGTTANRAFGTANQAMGTARNAQRTADNVAQEIPGIKRSISNVEGTANEAKRIANGVAQEVPPLRKRIADAIGLSEIANSRATNAERLAQQALQKSGKPGLQGPPGRDGRPGTPGRNGLDGRPGRDGRPGPAGQRGPAGKDGRNGLPGLAGRNGRDGKDAVNDPTIKPMIQQILNRQTGHIADTKASLASARAAAANSFNAAKEAIAANRAVVAVRGIATNIQTTATNTFQLLQRVGKFLRLGQVMNLLTMVATVHNAYMLSNALTQTFFSMMSNTLAVFGLRDENNQPIDITQELGQNFENFFAGMIGQNNVDGIKETWKKYNRIYQAAANIMWSIQSIGYSILGAMEIIGNWIAAIGNALKKFGVVGELAYRWMNPQVNFQNRFFTILNTTEEVISQVDAVAGETLSIQETVTNLGKQRTDFDKAVEEGLGPATPENKAIKDAADASKTSSVTPPISTADLSKPEV